MDVIVTTNLTKRYKDVTAVDGMNLNIRKGELFALLGVNGAGKTTAINMLSCLIKPTDGDALVGGYSVTQDPISVKRILGVSPQETAVAPNLTVQENLELIAGLHGFSAEKRKEKIRQLAMQFHLQDRLRKKAGKLSGGWQRRLSIAMALISDPDVLFLDEPTLGLDVIARSELWDVLKGLKGEITMVLTTHYLEEAVALSDRIGIMKNGRLLVVGNAKELTAQAGTDTFEQAFISIVKEVDVCEP